MTAYVLPLLALIAACPGLKPTYSDMKRLFVGLQKLYKIFGEKLPDEKPLDKVIEMWRIRAARVIIVTNR